ncbi:MAG TPA: ubiquitin-like small modifier protein 1 [Candidatus Methanoperedens sp.]|nr:MoaD family protein [Candidatus Methanoperedens sp.]HLB70283.1 ubiquitin-like small modifier protein 1 [Candidatus Methanoperedens sp.]
MVRIRFSSALSNVTHARETTLEMGECTVKTVLDKLIEQFGPDFERRILDKGEVRRFVNLYVNGEDIRHLKGLDSPVKDADEISILPAVSGG